MQFLETTIYSKKDDMEFSDEEEEEEEEEEDDSMNSEDESLSQRIYLNVMKIKIMKRKMKR